MCIYGKQCEDKGKYQLNIKESVMLLQTSGNRTYSPSQSSVETNIADSLILDFSILHNFDIQMAGEATQLVCLFARAQ